MPATTSARSDACAWQGACLHALRAKLHALEYAVEHLRQRGLGGGLVDVGARHQEDVVARPHRQQQRLSQQQVLQVVFVAQQPVLYSQALDLKHLNEEKQI